MAAYEAVLRVELTSEAELVKAVEILSRTLAGLVLDGHQAALAAEIVCNGCEDCTEDEEEQPTE